MREVLVPRVEPIQPVTTIRSTVLQSSLAALRARGHFDKWYASMEPRYRDAIVESLAPGWLPIEFAMAHYAGCDSLRLPNSEQLAIGEAVGDRIQGTFLATLMKTARATGLNPLVLLRQFDRLFNRLFQGGSIEVIQTGPKDLEVEIGAMPLSRYPYFRTAFSGVVRAGFVFSGVRASYVKQQSHNPLGHSFILRAAWV